MTQPEALETCLIPPEKFIYWVNVLQANDNNYDEGQCIEFEYEIPGGILSL